MHKLQGADCQLTLDASNSSTTWTWPPRTRTRNTKRICWFYFICKRVLTFDKSRILEIVEGLAPLPHAKVCSHPGMKNANGRRKITKAQAYKVCDVAVVLRSFLRLVNTLLGDPTWVTEWPPNGCNFILTSLRTHIRVCFCFEEDFCCTNMATKTSRIGSENEREWDHAWHSLEKTVSSAGWCGKIGQFG